MLKEDSVDGSKTGQGKSLMNSEIWNLLLRNMLREQAEVRVFSVDEALKQVCYKQNLKRKIINKNHF